MDPSSVSTGRLALREPDTKDVEAVFAVHGDPATNRFNPAGPHGSRDDSRRLLERWLAHWRSHRFGYWAVASRDARDHVLGFGGLMYKEMAGRRRANLYFRFRPSAWGKGYATELASAARELAFDHLGLDEVVATVRPANVPSIRVLERLGMVRAEDVSDAHGVSRLYVLRQTAT